MLVFTSCLLMIHLSLFSQITLHCQDECPHTDNTLNVNKTFPSDVSCHCVFHNSGNHPLQTTTLMDEMINTIKQHPTSPSPESMTNKQHLHLRTTPDWEHILTITTMTTGMTFNSRGLSKSLPPLSVSHKFNNHSHPFSPNPLCVCHTSPHHISFTLLIILFLFTPLVSQHEFYPGMGFSHTQTCEMSFTTSIHSSQFLSLNP